MSRQDEIEELISAHNRRLHKLRVQQAEQGITIDPKIPIEIENIELEIKRLQIELEQLREVGYLTTSGNEWFLEVGPPRSFAALGSMERNSILEFPFVFYNSGQFPIIVQNLRLIFVKDHPSKPFNFIATVEKLGTDKGRAFATQFPINPGKAELLICEFHREPGEMLFEARTYSVELQAIFSNSTDWRKICGFSLNIAPKNLNTINSRFLVYDNMAELGAT